MVLKNLPGACSGLRLATANEIMPGTGPSSCMAFLSVSMAAGLAFPSRDMPLMLTSWSLVSNLPSREAAPPCSTLLTNIPRSTTPSEKKNYYFLFKSCQKWPKDYIIISNFLVMEIFFLNMSQLIARSKKNLIPVCRVKYANFYGAYVRNCSKDKVCANILQSRLRAAFVFNAKYNGSMCTNK